MFYKASHESYLCRVSQNKRKSLAFTFITYYLFFNLPFILFHYDRHVGTIIACMFRTKLNPGGYFIFDIIKNSVFSKCEDFVIMC